MLGIQVTDNGPGVAKELMARIFTPYFTTRKDGLGMGLMMCRTIVESHQGTIRCTSQPGCGATFRFTLPIAPQEPEKGGGGKVQNSGGAP